jgi:hypothetical protein
MVWFVILAVITAGLALGLPPDPQTLHQLHISSLMYRVAIVILLVPYGIIWYTAFYAFAKLKEYSQSIKGFKDGKAFHSIMVGMGVLAFGLILPTAISLIMQAVTTHHPGFKPTSIIIDNYLGLLVALVAFVYINNGTDLLTRLSKNRPSLAGVRIFTLLFISLAALFTDLVINYHVKHGQVYYLNTPLLITTFIIPTLFAWFIAIFSAYEFGLYAKFVKGSLYRAALRQFSNGIIIAIAGSVASEFVDNTFAAKVSHSLGALLLAEYILLAIIAIGLILMALGAKKLKKIEEA